MRTLSDAALEVLGSIEAEGQLVRITGGQLDRTLYLEVNKALEALGGKWSRRDKAHVFEGDPRDAIDQVVLTGGFTDQKQEFGFFETPADVVDRLLDLAAIEDGMSVLEPSAGRGAIAIPVLERIHRVRLFAVELQPPNAAVLRSRIATIIGRELSRVRVSSPVTHQAMNPTDTIGRVTVIESDFATMRWSLSDPTPPVCDRVVMNPPFAREQDAEHIVRAYAVLKPGGRLVSVCSAGVKFRTTKKTAALRALAEAHGEIIDLPAGSFKESGTQVNTCIVVINKPIESEKGEDSMARKRGGRAASDVFVDDAEAAEHEPAGTAVATEEAPAPFQGELPTVDRSAELEAVEWVEPDDVKPNRYQPREHFDEAYIAELAESIRTQGQHTPAIARRLKDGSLELVFGECRQRACKLNKKLHGEAKLGLIVREYISEKAVKLATASENQQRRNLQPLEDAKCFKMLMTGDDAMSEAEVAAYFGISEKTVRRRLKLNDLTDVWRMFFAAHKGVSEECIRYVAKFSAELQKDLYEYLEKRHDLDEYLRLNTLREVMGRTLHLLSTAKWKLDDDGLCAKAGSCINCAKRTGCASQAKLFDEADFDPDFDEEAGGRRGKKKQAKVGVSDRCLDPACWDEKARLFVARRLAELEAEHGEVLLVSGDMMRADESGGTIQGRHQYEQVTKNARNAQTALDVDTGETLWLKKWSGAGSGQDRTAKSDKPKARPLKERMAQYDRRRCLIIVEQCKDWLKKVSAAMTRGKVDTQPCNEMLLALVFVFGTDTKRDSAWDHRARKTADEFEKAMDPKADTDMQLRIAGAAALRVLHQRLHTLQNLKPDDVEQIEAETRMACRVCRMDFVAKYEAAARDVKYPKAWGQEADKITFKKLLDIAAPVAAKAKARAKAKPKAKSKARAKKKAA